MDGRSLEILSPGIPNHNGGPDFSDAQIRIGGRLYRGSIEIHRTEEEWKSHRHHKDIKYNRVILHVVLRTGSEVEYSATESSRSVPVLALETYLSPSWHVASEPDPQDKEDCRETIRCIGMNTRADSSLIETWIEKLAVERFELKVRRFDERLHEILKQSELHIYEPSSRYEEIPFGLQPDELPPPATSVSAHEVCNPSLWNQVLYEGVMEALGYSKNQQSFLLLARSVTLDSIQRILGENILAGEPSAHVEALLFGVAGLLPAVRGLTEPQSRKEIRRMRSLWKRTQPAYRHERLSSSDWQFFRLRPENFPTIRLAGAARLLPQLIDSSTFKSIIREVKQAGVPPHEKVRNLKRLFVVPADGFWSSHYRFGEPAHRWVKTLVGDSRAQDILINVVIPICLLYGRVFRDKSVRQEALALAASCPPFAENSITIAMQEQLVRNRFRIGSVLTQQGMIQLYKMFCLEERCGECAIGKTIF